MTNIKSIKAGNENVIAVTKDGKAVTWGYNGYSQLANGNNDSVILPIDLKYSENGDLIDEIFDVSASLDNITVARNDGKVYAIGRNNGGQVGDSSTANKNEFVCISNSRICFDESPIRITRCWQDGRN